MSAADGLRLLPPDHLRVGEPVAVEFRAHDGPAHEAGVREIEEITESPIGGVRLSRRLRRLFGIREVDVPVLRELGVDCDVQQAALFALLRPVRRSRHVLDRLGQLPVRENAQPSRLFGDEQAPIRQERHSPRKLERSEPLDADVFRGAGRGIARPILRDGERGQRDRDCGDSHSNLHETSPQSEECEKRAGRSR